jgi:hypothetical protein
MKRFNVRGVEVDVFFRFAEYSFEGKKYSIEVPSYVGEGNKVEKRLQSRVATEIRRMEQNANERRFHKAAVLNPEGDFFLQSSKNNLNY